jgi:hypothetical protein
LFLSRQNTGAATFFSDLSQTPRGARGEGRSRRDKQSRRWRPIYGFGKFPASLIMKGGATVKNILPA